MNRVECKLFSMLEGDTKHLNVNVDGGAGEVIASRKREIVGMFSRSIRECQALAVLYDEFAYILDEESKVEAYMAKEMHPAEELKEQVNKYRAVGNLLSDSTHAFIRTPMILTDCQGINEALIQKAHECSRKILEILADGNIKENLRVHEQFKHISQTLLKKPINTEELVSLIQALKNFKEVSRAKIFETCVTTKEQLWFLYDCQHKVGREILNAIGESWDWLKKIDGIVAQSNKLVASESNKMEQELDERRIKFANVLESYSEGVKRLEQNGVSCYTKPSEYNSIVGQINALKENIELAEKEVEVIREQEAMLNMPETDFSSLVQTKLDLEPYEELWGLVVELKASLSKFGKTAFAKLDANHIQNEVDRMFRAGNKLTSLFSEKHEPQAVAEQIKKELNGFKPHLPLLQVLCNKGMEDRHWETVREVLDYQQFNAGQTVLETLTKLAIDIDIVALQEIGERATKEFTISGMLSGMKAEWEPMELGLKDQADTFILMGDSVDETQTLLDDHIIKTQTIRGNPFAKFFMEEIVAWEAWLMSTQEIMEVWLKVQGAWMYLEPVFGSDDIVKQMPTEGKLFKTVNANWCKLMSDVSSDPKVLKCALLPNMLNILQEARTLLDQISAGLNRYLETKRLFFPRFFFLSNDELLEILSETKDPLRVQPHIKKCFEGVKSLEFKENLDISGMKSSEGEIVDAVRIINPLDAKGAVEKWLRDFEYVMMDTIKDQAAKSLEDYTQKARTDWVDLWPGQIVIAISQIYWTRDVEEAIKDIAAGNKDALSKFYEKSNEDLNFIVLKVRGKLPKLVRCTLGALIVIDVHARDVINLLKDEGVNNVTDFEWISQLRYYWEDELVVARMITSRMEYGNEYIGNSARLVITALTDRCYRTLMCALELNLGGAPEGPAGTGKTETVKDLSKALAIACIVFNCSDGLDFQAMGKFFKGLAASGAWACFDEFNRIDLEVLSVVAQQIQTIIRAKEAKVETFMFEGTELPLRVRCNCFITMNPGYAGRSDLPDNLKSLFRTVAMMVPDYGLIAEILLYSFGFVEAKTLSRKIVSTYKLCSELLSSQDHYDYGMRAVRTVLTASQNLKMAFPEDDETRLMLQAIIDCNLPKFLTQDLDLFDGIMSDLFPGVPKPNPDYELLLKALNENMVKLNLQPKDIFVTKIIQLYETIRVRHGLMIVGLPFAGKTSNYRLLAAALTDLSKEKLLGEEMPVEIKIINPKSITSGQLYGNFDPVSNEWYDGILATSFRDFAVDNSPSRKWLLFDGPVDAVWIENMNTVLDDNRKLCLMSGQIILMNETMNIIFECRDLAVASPATVSRCGMVYMEPHVLGIEPFIVSWLNTLPKFFSEDSAGKIKTLCNWLVPPCVKFAMGCKHYSPSTEQNIVVSTFRIFEACFKDAWVDKGTTEEAVGALNVIGGIESMLLFALVWSAGAVVDEDGRSKFDKFLKELMKEQNQYKLGTKFPNKGTCFDYVYKADENQFIAWSDTLPMDFQIPKGTAFSQILVPNVDSARYQHFIEMFIRHNLPINLVGPTGTGKSTYVYSSLYALDKDKYQTMAVNFSAQTSAKQTQWLIDDKLDRRRRGIYGPRPGFKMVIFVDDLNMPKLEEYGAQPPIELLRQFMDHGGWYDIKELAFHQLVDVQFMAAMGPPGGGRNFVTDRYLRHFTQISCTPFDENVMKVIFTTILDWNFSSQGFSPDVGGMSSSIVQATRDIYDSVCSKLLPTPAKSHYTYNLRDFARVVQGCMMIAPSDCDDSATMIRLWVHEVHRVFCDRLVNDEDRNSFLGWVRDIVGAKFGKKFDDVCKHLDSNSDKKVDTQDEIRALFFGDYMVKKLPRPYQEIQDLDLLSKTWNDFLEDYNDMTSKPMKLVMFQFAIEHASRIARIIKQPRGNALLVGVGGSGKQSLTRLATHVLEYDIFTVELTKSYDFTAWREDMKNLLRKAGGQNKVTTFLLTDTQIKSESFLEDVNGILNAGEVPNLYTNEELTEVLEETRVSAKKVRHPAAEGTPSQLFAYFTSCVRENLHIVLCMSPIGDAFRTRLRMFPSLINCCTIDWFAPWPKDALESVARDFLADVELEDEVRSSCVTMCMSFHKDCEDLAGEFLQQLGRNYYVTPTSYLELITTFKTLLAARREYTTQLRNRYQVGLDKIDTTEKSINVMQKELEEMQPVLKKTAEETDEMVKIVSAENVEANKIRESVAKEEAVASQAANASKAIEMECSADLAEAMPILEKALSALDTLTTGDIAEVKAMRNPAVPVKLVMEALCIMKNLKPVKVPDPDNPGRQKLDFWPVAQKQVLSDTQLLKSLKAYDKDNIDPAIIKKIRGYMQMPEFANDVVAKVSKAAGGLSSWIFAMEAYDRVAKQVAPKKAALKQAQEEYAVVKKGLDAAQAELQKVEDKIGALQANLDAMKKKKQELEDNMAMCAIKLERANKLLGGLGGEKSRWTQIAIDLGESYGNITGDVLISSGVISYLGAFTVTFREKAVSMWVQKNNEMKVPCSENFSLQAICGDSVQTRAWVLDGLPNDGFSIDNAIIISKSRRWPLMIDPQTQANKWIRTMEKERNLSVFKPTDDYSRKLEAAIQFGYPCLLENVAEDVDPALEPLLLKQVFKRANMNVIKFGENEIEYNNDFRFYMTTKYRNPHYLPEVSVKVCLLNFMITPEGLEDQLLGIVVAAEKPKLEAERNELVVSSANNARRLKEIEDQILQVLSSSQGNILDDEGAIEVLTSAKVVSNEIEEKQKIAAVTEEEINKTRVGYKPVAFHSSVLFFCISELANIDPMYQYSLGWFITLFRNAIKNSTPDNDLAKRCVNLNDYTDYSLYLNVCRSLFQKDILMFSFILNAKVLLANKVLDPDLYRFFLTGGVGINDGLPSNPCGAWLLDKAWFLFCRLGEFERFKGIADHLKENEEAWKALYDTSEPDKEPMPGAWNEQDSFGRMLILRCLRPDKVIPAGRTFVAEKLGQKFIEAPPFDLVGSYADSAPDRPIVFILSAGSDPMGSLLKFATERKFADKVQSISLGQGQGPIAEGMIEAGMKAGTWIVLQNCHLAVSWMTSLERICDNINPAEVHPDFRLWMTSYPSDKFPVSILQNGVKLTTEPPKGLKSNILGSYLRDPISEPDFFDGLEKIAELKTMTYALCFFHALIQERRQYGPLGWNIPYEYNESDMRISIRQLKIFLTQAGDREVPYKALNYLTGHCNYGGRVTDNNDRLCLTTLLSNFYNPNVHDAGYKLSASGVYVVPPVGDWQSYVDFIKDLPLSAAPEVYGLHENADITKDQNETNALLSSILTAESGGGGGGGGDRTSALNDLSKDILNKVPERFDIDYIQGKYPVLYSESMNTVLVQECMRYNKLVDVIRSSLVNLQKALVGLVVMSSDLETLANQMSIGVIPAMWKAQSYPSLKPLGSFISDLVERLAFLQDWVANGQPVVTWMSGIFFVHSFLTGALQNYARKYKIAVDTIEFDFDFLDESEINPKTPKPADGVYVRGLFLEGARWDSTSKALTESEPKVLFTKGPVIWLKPCKPEDRSDFKFYNCPTYVETSRRGVLRTTGHSSNFIMHIRLPTLCDPGHWVKRGVALVTQLAD